MSVDLRNLIFTYLQFPCSALIPNSFQESRHILCSNPNAIQQLIIRTSMFSSIKKRDWEFFSLVTAACHSFIGKSSCLAPHSSLHKAHKLLKNFISSKLMSTDSGLRSWPRGGCCCSSTYYCVNLAWGVE
jgi:hypothetical protein